MAAPAAPSVDEFNRGSLGAAWSAWVNGGLAIHGSTQLGGGSNNAYTGSQFETVECDRPCEAIITAQGVYGTPNYLGLSLLDTSDNGYKIGLSSNLFNWTRVDAGEDVNLGTRTMVNNVPMAIQLDATHARFWTDEGAGMVERASFADTNHDGPFKVVVDIYDPGGDEVRADSLHFGEIGGSTLVELAASLASSSGAGGALTVTRALAAELDSLSGLDADLLVTRTLEAELASSSGFASTLTGINALSAILASGSVLSGNLTATRQLAAILASDSTMVGRLLAGGALTAIQRFRTLRGIGR